MIIPLGYLERRPNAEGRRKVVKEVTALLVAKGLTPDTLKFNEVMRRHMAKPKNRDRCYHPHEAVNKNKFSRSK